MHPKKAVHSSGVFVLGSTLLHREVVTGDWTLAQGQQYIRTHWNIYYIH